MAKIAMIGAGSLVFAKTLAMDILATPALRGADYVIAMLQVGGLEAFRSDYEIPLRWGVDQCIGDTLGPGGVLRLLRSPLGLPSQPERERYPWRQFHLIPGRKLSSAWGQDKGRR